MIEVVVQPADLSASAGTDLPSQAVGDLETFGSVNADLIFPKSAEPKFPTLAGAAISRRRDRGLRFLAAGRAA